MHLQPPAMLKIFHVRPPKKHLFILFVRGSQSVCITFSFLQHSRMTEQGHVHAEPMETGTVSSTFTPPNTHTHMHTLISHSDTPGVVSRGHIEMGIRWDFYPLSSPEFLLIMIRPQSTPMPPSVSRMHLIMENDWFSLNSYILETFWKALIGDISTRLHLPVHAILESDASAWSVVPGSCPTTPLFDTIDK